METLSQNTARDFHDIIRDSDIDATLQAILAADKVSELQVKPGILGKELHINSAEVRDVLWWAADRYDQTKLLAYLHEFDYTPAQMIEQLDRARTPEQRVQWQEDYGDWRRRPTIELRYAQLVSLKDKQEMIQQTYPELELRLMARKDKTIAELMPSFSPGDTFQDRITNPATPLGQIYHGGVGVDPRLLQAIRGRITANPQGIDFYRTPYGELNKRMNLFEDDGLCLIGKHPVSYELIKEIELMTSIDCSGANLATGIALALNGRLRIGDDISLPQSIANAEANYCSGLRVMPEYAQYGDIPRLYFELRKQDDLRNCALVINP